MSERIIIRLGTREYAIELNGEVTRINGREISVESVTLDGNGGLVIWSGSQILHAGLEVGDEDGWVTFRGRELPLTYETERHRLLKKFASAGVAIHAHAELRASMPGLVVRVLARPGAEVRKGSAVMILEAMKMENEIRAPIDGSVKSVLVSQGQAVEKGDLLMVLD